MRLSLVARWNRAWTFARYMPARKLTRRIELQLTRALRDRGLDLTTLNRRKPTDPERACTPRRPLFPPRTSRCQSTNATLAFTFLAATHVTPLASIDWNAPGPGSRHQLWRMNLHYMEYLEGLPDETFETVVADWLRHHAQAKPGSWRDSWNAYALSIRVVVWMQQLAIRPSLTLALVQQMNASLIEQLRFLEKNLETDLGGNHLIKNIKALLWGAAFFEGVEARRWGTQAVRLLRDQLDRQILPDGMHDERSPSYHCQIFADLIECRQTVPTHPEVASILDAKLTAMAQVVADMTMPDGTVAQFNDAGATMAYSPEACLGAFSALGYPLPSQRHIFALPDAGYFGAHLPTASLIIDCGRIAPDDLPAHGHGDILSFELCIAGHRVIVDQGVLEYVAGPARQACRSSRHHNTLAIDGIDQAEFFGAFRCGRRPNVGVRRYETSGQGFILEGTHDGYASLPGSPRPVRRFELKPGDLLIEDWLDGTTSANVSIAYLLHPAAVVTASALEARISIGRTTVTLRCSHSISIEEAVWWPDMGVERTTQRLRIALGSQPSDQRVITQVSWAEDQTV